MKCQIPQISWHSRDPVLSIDFQPCEGNRLRLASGGTDSHVLIWYITYQDNKSISIECASDLYRHNKSVNVVRFSPLGDILASGDDEGAMFLWQLKERDPADISKDEDNINQEDWYPLKLLRGHLEDIYDISWSADGNFLMSASMDNTAIMWDVQKFQKLHIFSDSKGYVQGVAWDPLNVYIATIGTDRALRILNINSKKTAFRVQRAPWSVTTEKGTFRARLFHDDTLKSYFRRLCFTPDGELLIVPSGILEKDDKLVNTTYIFSRHAPNKAVAYLPTGDKYTVAVRCSPLLYKLHCSQKDKENQDSKPLLNLPYRMVFAVAACDSVVIYDTEQLVPIAYISNIHYTHLTDLTWSADGRILVAASTDGYCSFIIFNDELGEVYEPPQPVVSPVKAEIIKEPFLPQITPQNNTVNEIIVVNNAPEKALKIESIDCSSEISEVPDKKSAPTSPSEIQSPNVIKSKKPKLTIKNFFALPKAKPTINVIGKDAEINSPKDGSLNKCLFDSEDRIEELHLSPRMNDNDNLNNTKMEKNSVICEESCSIEFIFEKPKSRSSVMEKNELKGKISPDYADKVKHGQTALIISKPDLNDIVAVASFDSAQEISEKIEDENDWKLELSQDEEMPPVDIAVSNTSKEVKPEPMDVTESNTSNNEMRNVSKTPTKPKRRVNFITLATKITKTPPKE